MIHSSPSAASRIYRGYAARSNLAAALLAITSVAAPAFADNFFWDANAPLRAPAARAIG